MSIELLDLSSSGIELHSVGATTANALSPYVFFDLWIFRILVSGFRFGIPDSGLLVLRLITYSGVSISMISRLLSKNSRCPC